MRYYSIEERVDLSEVESVAAKQLIKELEYQIFDNPAWTDMERLWWNAMRSKVLGMVDDHEIEKQKEYMRGVEFGNFSAGLGEAS